MTAILFGSLALLGTIITTIQALLTHRFRRSAPPFFGDGLHFRQAGSFISILKPVCGLDDELEENLVSFTRLEGIRYEVIISAEEADDPALEVVRRVMRAHPSAPFRIVIDGGSRTGVVNRKVERLIAAARVAKGDLYVISDSNVRVERADLARTLQAFADPRVGCVSNLFVGAGASNFGAVIESLHLLGFVLPGAVSVRVLDRLVVVGKSMAITPRALAAAGGFERFRRVLAEDQAIAVAVKAVGYQVVLSPIVVRNVVVHRSLKRAIDRQVRWNKIRYSFSHWTYASELLLNPLPFALVIAFVAPAVLLGVLAARYAQFVLLDQTTGAGMTWKQIALVPLLDLAMLYSWFVPFFSNKVTWRGYRASLGRGTEMIQIAA